MTDPVKAPAHYMGDGETSCMIAMASMVSNVRVKPMQAYWWLCAFKYVWRWPFKNGRQDIKKAIRCLEYLLLATEEEGSEE